MLVCKQAIVHRAWAGLLGKSKGSLMLKGPKLLKSEKEEITCLLEITFENKRKNKNNTLL